MTQTNFHTEEIHAIKCLIQSFFDRINSNDPQGLQTLFVPHADLTIIRQDPPAPPPPSPPPPPSTASKEVKLTVVLRTSIENFIKMIQDGNQDRKPGSGPDVHEVPDLDTTDVRVDGLFAYAWCPFRVTFDGELHHFGNFVYTLGRVDGDGDGEGGKEWKFEGLTQNYRRTPGWEGQEGRSEFV